MGKPNFGVFNRVVFNLRYYSLINEWNKRINLKNIARIRPKKLLMIYKLEDSELFLAYLFNLYAKWLKMNYTFNTNFIQQAWKIARKLKIADHFNVAQRQILENIEENIFTAERSLKQIDTTLPLSPREKCYMFYEKIPLSIRNGEDHKNNYTCTVYFTNRNLFAKANQGKHLFKIPYHKIAAMSAQSDCFFLKTTEKKELTFWLANSEVLFHSFEKLRKYKKWPWTVVK